MSAKMSANALKRFDEAVLTDPQREIPVIVTIRKGADLAALEQKGLRIQRTFENISAVAGTIPAAEVNTLVELDEVETIDYDETARALWKHVKKESLAGEFSIIQGKRAEFLMPTYGKNVVSMLRSVENTGVSILRSIVEQ